MRILGKDVALGISIGGRNVHLVNEYLEAGFTTTELDMPIFFADMRDTTKLMPDTESLYEQITKSGLGMRSVHLPFGIYWDISVADEEDRRAVVKDFKWTMDQVAKMGEEVMVLHPSAEPIFWPKEREAKLQACERSIAELVEYADKIGGAKLVLEDLPRTCLGNTSEEIARLTKNGTLLNVCLDTTHLFHENTMHFLDACANWVGHTHLSDYDGVQECHWNPGKGVVPWRELFIRLTEVGYDGPFNFELRNGDDGQTPYAPQLIVDGFVNAIEGKE